MDAFGAIAGFRRDRWIIAASVLALTGMAWLYLWLEAGRMSAMPMGAPVRLWDMGPLIITFVMWSIMMVGMMLPSAAPAITLYAAIVRKSRPKWGSSLASTGLFTAGYIAVWTGFSAIATLAQTGLISVGLLTPMLASDSRLLTGGLLAVAGLYQWFPIKRACLKKCRAPLSFFVFHWKPGFAGAFRMGAAHGAFCLGCCWALMLLLFGLGVMNLLWVALIAGLVLMEKLLPAGHMLGGLTGLAMLAAGVWQLATAGIL